MGSHLINNAALCGYKLFYWRDGNDEVDYVIYDGEHLCAIEVKSGSQTKGRGMEAFKKKFPAAKVYTVCNNPLRSSGFIGLEEFLKLPPDMLL